MAIGIGLGDEENHAGLSPGSRLWGFLTVPESPAAPVNTGWLIFGLGIFSLMCFSIAFTNIGVKN